VTALALPTAAYASGLTFNGIEGANLHKANVTSGADLQTGVFGSSGHQADVTPSGQILVTNDDPSHNLSGTPPYVWGGSLVPDTATLTTSGSCVNFEPLNLPSTQNFVLTELQVNITTDSSPGAGNDVKVFTDQNCSGTPESFDTPATVGLSVVPISPEITTVGPDGNIKGGNGDYLSAEVDGNVQATIIANGYVAAT